MSARHFGRYLHGTGIQGTLACSMVIFDKRLLPIKAMASALGPIKVKPAFSHARAKSHFLIKSHPGG